MIDLNVTGDRRKKLVKRMESILGVRAYYMAMPTCAFRVGDYEVSKTGQVTPNLPEDVVAALARAGYTPVGQEEDAAPEEEVPEVDGITITIPLSMMSEAGLTNFKNMAASKAELIKAAFGLNDLPPVEVDDGVVKVHWFDGLENTEHAQEFVKAMAEKAELQKYVSAKPLETDNPKYSFRVFLNALGFKGGNYKRLRRDLLANLEGSSAWRHGKPEGSAI